MNEREKQLGKDLAAYKSLRQQGIQPKCIDGSADLATRATTSYEIESGRILPTQMAERVERTSTELKEAGVLQ
jgi:hypothetical protein